MRYTALNYLNFILGLPSQISYVPGTGPQALFSDASFSMCEKETHCEEPATITANVILETDHIGKVSQIYELSFEDILSRNAGSKPTLLKSLKSMPCLQIGM